MVSFQTRLCSSAKLRKTVNTGLRYEAMPTQISQLSIHTMNRAILQSFSQEEQEICSPRVLAALAGRMSNAKITGTSVVTYICTYQNQCQSFVNRLSRLLAVQEV